MVIEPIPTLASFKKSRRDMDCFMDDMASSILVKMMEVNQDINNALIETPTCVNTTGGQMIRFPVLT